MKADLLVDLGPTKTTGADFNVKAFPATNGVGLEGDAILTLAEYEIDFTVNLEGTGSVALRGTKHDPLDEIEVVKVRRATYTEGDLIAHARNIGRIPAADYLPYYYGRSVDDWSEMNTEDALGSL